MCYLILFICDYVGKNLHNSTISWFIFEIQNFFMADFLKIWLFLSWFCKYDFILLKIGKIRALLTIGCKGMSGLQFNFFIGSESPYQHLWMKGTWNFFFWGGSEKKTTLSLFYNILFNFIISINTNNKIFCY